MSNDELMEKVIELAATFRDEGGAGVEFVASTMTAIGSICGACKFPKESVKDIAMAGLDTGYKGREEFESETAWSLRKEEEE
tara:strand:+ start:1616 stop:1861 length:246 start_codon:yes stop_codon:yes gene_type:complete